MSFNFMATVTIHGDFGAQENEVCHCFHFSPSICDEVLGPDAMILVTDKYKCVQKTIQTMTAAMKLKNASSLEEKL